MKFKKILNSVVIFSSVLGVASLISTGEVSAAPKNSALSSSARTARKQQPPTKRSAKPRRVNSTTRVVTPTKAPSSPATATPAATTTDTATANIARADQLLTKINETKGKLNSAKDSKPSASIDSLLATLESMKQMLEANKSNLDIIQSYEPVYQGLEATAESLTQESPESTPKAEKSEVGSAKKTPSKHKQAKATQSEIQKRYNKIRKSQQAITAGTTGVSTTGIGAPPPPPPPPPAPPAPGAGAVKKDTEDPNVKYQRVLKEHTEKRKLKEEQKASQGREQTEATTKNMKENQEQIARLRAEIAKLETLGSSAQPNSQEIKYNLSQINHINQQLTQEKNKKEQLKAEVKLALTYVSSDKAKEDLIAELNSLEEQIAIINNEITENEKEATNLIHGNEKLMKFYQNGKEEWQQQINLADQVTKLTAEKALSTRAAALRTNAASLAEVTDAKYSPVLPPTVVTSANQLHALVDAVNSLNDQNRVIFNGFSSFKRAVFEYLVLGQIYPDLLNEPSIHLQFDLENVKNANQLLKLVADTVEDSDTTNLAKITATVRKIVSPLDDKDQFKEIISEKYITNNYLFLANDPPMQRRQIDQKMKLIQSKLQTIATAASNVEYRGINLTYYFMILRRSYLNPDDYIQALNRIATLDNAQFMAEIKPMIQIQKSLEIIKNRWQINMLIHLPKDVLTIDQVANYLQRFVDVSNGIDREIEQQEKDEFNRLRPTDSSINYDKFKERQQELKAVVAKLTPLYQEREPLAQKWKAFLSDPNAKGFSLANPELAAQAKANLDQFDREHQEEIKPLQQQQQALEEQLKPLNPIFKAVTEKHALRIPIIEAEILKATLPPEIIIARKVEEKLKALENEHHVVLGNQNKLQLGSDQEVSAYLDQLAQRPEQLAAISELQDLFTNITKFLNLGTNAITVHFSDHGDVNDQIIAKIAKIANKLKLTTLLLDQYFTSSRKAGDPDANLTKRLNDILKAIEENQETTNPEIVQIKNYKEALGRVATKFSINIYLLNLLKPKDATIPEWTDILNQATTTDGSTNQVVKKLLDQINRYLPKEAKKANNSERSEANKQIEAAQFSDKLHKMSISPFKVAEFKRSTEQMATQLVIKNSDGQLSQVNQLTLLDLLTTEATTKNQDIVKLAQDWSQAITGTIQGKDKAELPETLSKSGYLISLSAKIEYLSTGLGIEAIAQFQDLRDLLDDDTKVKTVTDYNNWNQKIDNIIIQAKKIQNKERRNAIAKDIIKGNADALLQAFIKENETK